MLVLHMLINGCGGKSVQGACIPINSGTALAMMANLGEASKRGIQACLGGKREPSWNDSSMTNTFRLKRKCLSIVEWNQKEFEATVMLCCCQNVYLENKVW